MDTASLFLASEVVGASAASILALVYTVLARHDRIRAEQALKMSEDLVETLSRAAPRKIEAQPPRWGTPDRKRYHADLRDFHANMVVEAGKAARGETPVSQPE